MNYLILIIVAIAGIALGIYFGRKSAKTFTPKQPEEMKKMRVEAHEALNERTEERKQKILNLMNSEEVHQEELEACNVVDVRKGITSENMKNYLMYQMQLRENT